MTLTLTTQIVLFCTNVPGDPEQHDTAVRRIVDHVVLYEGVLARHTDPVCPLLKVVRSTRADIIVLYRGVIAQKATFGNVEAGPTPRIERVDILDKLVGVYTTELDVCTYTFYVSMLT